jgi:Fic family protein
VEGLIKEMHAILFQGIKVQSENIGGEYKKRDNHVLTISGQIQHYTPHMQVQGEMEKLIHWYEEHMASLHPIELATIFHHKLVAIHPFLDGNGRLSRLCMNFIVMKFGYPPVIIRQENRQDYYSALEAADQGELQPFIRLVADEAQRSLEVIEDALG